MARSPRKAPQKGKRRPQKRTKRTKKKPSRFTPLKIAVLAGVALAVILGVVLFWPSDEQDDVPVIVEAPVEESPADGMDNAQSDAIGHLIASLPPEEFDVPPPAPRALPPIPAAPGRMAWQDHAVAALLSEGPKIAIVIDDVGLNRARTEEVIALEAPLTLAFLPYGADLPVLTQKARAAGHELLVHIPMQPSDDSVDPGPDALLIGLSDQQIKDRLDQNLGQFDGFVGFNNHMGSRFTADRHGMAVVMAEAKRRGLMFLDSRTTTATQGRAMAERYGVPILERDIFLDNITDEAAIRAQLDKAAQHARKYGSAIVIAHPYEETVSVLQDWLKDSGGVTPVPLSALMGRERGS